MRILHLADLHLGRTLYKKSLFKEQQKVLEQVFDVIETEKIDVVIIAGDIFDKDNIAKKYLNYYNQWMQKLLKKVKVFVIAGNHDNSALLTFGAELFADFGYYTTGNLSKILPKITLTDQYGPVNFYLLPYFRPSEVTEFEVSTDLDENQILAELINKQQINYNERNILIMHDYIVGKNKTDLMMAESESMNLGTGMQFSYEIIQDFDYVALGHLHNPQKVGNSNIRYAGTPYPYSFSEAKWPKKWTIIELKEKGNVEIKLEEINLPRQLVTLEGEIENILAEYPTSDDYIQLILTEYTTKYSQIQLLEAFPNLLTIKQKEFIYHEMKNEINELDEVKIKKEPLAIIKDFYKEKTSEELTTEELTIIQAILEEEN